MEKVTGKGLRMNVSITPGFVGRWIIMAGLLLAATHGAWADSTFTVPAGERQLFLDDVGTAKIENLDRTMHQPDKRGAVVRSSKPNQTFRLVPRRSGTPTRSSSSSGCPVRMNLIA